MNMEYETMRRTISMMVAFMAIIGSCAIFASLSDEHSFTARAGGTGTNETALALIWQSLNETRSDINSLEGKIDYISGKVDVINTKSGDILTRLGYGNTDAAVFNVKEDFDRIYQAMYSENGTSNFQVLNENQASLSAKTTEIAGSILNAEDNINSHTSSVVDTGFTNNYVVIILILIIMLLSYTLIKFFVGKYSGATKIHEEKEHGESLFMQAAPQQTVDDRPDCFRKLYNGNSNDCKSCALKEECSGRPVRRSLVIKKSPVENRIKVL
jgi:hypothetical protein